MYFTCQNKRERKKRKVAQFFSRRLGPVSHGWNRNNAAIKSLNEKADLKKQKTRIAALDFWFISDSLFDQARGHFSGRGDGGGRVQR